jgi:hypothetical protein
MILSTCVSVLLPTRLAVLNSYGKILSLLLVIIAAGQLSACDINIRAGTKPNVLALESNLKPGLSTEQEVLKALGDPVGKGREMMPFMAAPRDTWTYYYEQGDLNDDRRLFLFVFFANGKYDGYMWFSSLR